MYRYVLIFILFAGCYVPVARAATDSANPRSSFGSGWLVAPHFVVTNHHVVSNSNQAVVRTSKHVRLQATVVIRDVVNDLVLLKIDTPSKLPAALPLADQAPNMGEQIFTIGYPHPDVMGTDPKLSVGIISSLTGLANDPRTLQISAPVQSGSSGGPLLNMRGEVIGIVTSKLNAMKMFKWTGDIPQNVNYAVKVNYLRVLLQTTRTDKHAALEVLPVQSADLVRLTQRVRDSVVLVESANQNSGAEVADASDIPEGSTPDNDKTPAPKSTQASRKLAMFIYMQRGDYDDNGDLDSTDTYSNNTANLIKAYISKAVNTLSVQYVMQGWDARSRYYDTFKVDKGRALCKQHTVDYLLAVANSYDTTIRAEDVEFVLHRCDTNKYVQKVYWVDNKISDSFIYETDLKRAIKSFLNEYRDFYQ